MMKRYYFDMREGDHIAPDDEGMKLATIEAVQGEAARTLADMVRDLVRKRHDGAGHQMALDVRDDDGPVLQVKFTFAIDRHRN